MRIRRLCFSWFSLGVMVMMGGCPSDPLDELIEESPFHAAQATSGQDIRILTCRCFVLELPKQVNLTQMGFWQQFNPVWAKPVDPNQSPSLSTMPLNVEEARLWKANGLAIAAAPLASWPTLQRELVERGAQQRAEWISQFRSVQESSRFETAAIEPTSLYVFDKNLAGRGYTLPEGRGAFRASFVPYSGEGTNRELYFTIVPVFIQAEEQIRFGEDEAGNLGRIRNHPEILFEQVTLTGALAKDSFVCIAAAPAPASGPTLGSVLLSEALEEKERQMVLVLVPRLQTAQEVVEEREKE